MRKLLLVAVLATASFCASAQLKFAENFGGMTAGNLGTQNSWVQAGSGTDVQVTVLPNNTGALVRPGYTSGQNYITANDIEGTDPYKSFNANTSIAANSTTYIAFLVRVGSNSNTLSEALTLPSVALRTTSGSNLGYFYIADNGADLKFGIAKNESGIGDGQYATADFSFNTTYLIIIRYDVVSAGGSDDLMYCWVNPALTSEPAIGSAAVSVTTGSDGGYSGSLSALQLFQQRFSFGFTWSSAEASFDAFRVANRPTSPAAWLDLNPQGAPLPVKLGNIKAFEKSNGVQLEWTAYAEANLGKYMIERSADGENFTSIGEVTAQNTGMETKYGFLDASPLAGVNFYRLKHIDVDSRSGFSSIVRLNLDKSNTSVTLYPNPVRNGIVSFQSSNLSKGSYDVKVFNATGQQVYVQKIAHTGGAINQTIQLPAGVRSGMYSLQLDRDGEKVMNKIFMVQ